MRTAAELVDDAERLAAEGGKYQALLRAAQLLGFDDWPAVAHVARDRRGRVAIELLCRRVERAL